jgi:hypothetical protein
MKRIKLPATQTILLSLLLLMMCACTRQENFYAAIDRAMLQKGNNPFDPNYAVAGVDDGDDARIPNYLKDGSVTNLSFVNRCTPERYAAERKDAIDRAKADNTLIPVKFSLYTGTLFDSLAYAAHRRSILRKDSTMESRIPVGPANVWAYTGANAYHYVVNHADARSNFLKGEKCFFDTVKVVRGVAEEIRNEAGQVDHGYRIFCYGDIYQNPSSADIVDGGVSPRLFKKLTAMDYTQEDPQVVPLYVADIREKMLAELGINAPVLNPNFASSAVRRKEYQMGYKEIFNLKTLWTHRNAVTRILSTDRTLNDRGLRAVASDSVKRAYSAYEGVPQLIDWIVFSGLSATVMSTQYTPIVLDLGQEKIRTSSLDWGTFFNLAGLKDNRPHLAATGIESGVSHLTAWLGGYVVQSDENNSVVADSPQRVAEDGFLVLPNPNGSVTGAGNLFGDGFTLVNGTKTTRFSNGFEALAAFAKKDCKVDNLKSHYIGPWDGETYESSLKVWVDRNRNGVAETGEVKTLRESGVAAMNVCHIVHAQAKDKFGNRTELRAAFLKFDEADANSLDDEEILRRLSTGKNAAGAPAGFRVMVDVFFNTLPQSYLEDIAPSNITFADGSPLK